MKRTILNKPHVAFLLVFIFLLLSAAPTRALGTPDWARPYLRDPAPSGPYIARSDHWAILYGEIVFSDTNGRISEHHRYVLENMTDRSIAFSSTLYYDQSRCVLGNTALNVQRKFLWHTINLKREAAQGNIGGTMSIVVAGTEDVPAHHRVVWEYSYTMKESFPPWDTILIPQAEPAAKMRFALAPDADDLLQMEVSGLEGGKLPPEFELDKEGGLTVSHIPAMKHLDDGLIYQPIFTSLYPCVIVSFRTKEAESWKAFKDEYIKGWSKLEAKLDHKLIAARAATLTKGLSTPVEKADALARFVSVRILYDDSNEKGLNAWLPLTPRETLRSMKADCKGKVMLLGSLLKSVGIKSAPVLLYSSFSYARWRKKVAGAPFNHVIIAVYLPPADPPLPATLLTGPAKGWVLFDPTLKSIGFGAPLPGFEGVPILFMGAAGDEPFNVHTVVPSAAYTSVSGSARLDVLNDLDCSVEVKGNGASSLFYDLLNTPDERDRTKEILKHLRYVVTEPELQTLKVKTPRPGKDEGSTVTIDFRSQRGAEEMSAAYLMSNPLAAAAMMAGLPNGLSRRHTTPEEDRVTLSPPWNAHLNTMGLSRKLDVKMRVSIPATLRWTPPPPNEIKEPWLTYSQRWTQTAKGAYTVEVHLEMPRGRWSPKTRIERLREIDGVYSAFYSPLILKKMKQGRPQSRDG